MDPLLRVIKFIFDKFNKKFEDETVDSFFDNGISFPRFVALIFNLKSIKNIGNINESPSTSDQIQDNNIAALEFLHERNRKVVLPDPIFENKNELLRLILNMSFETTNCVQINEDKIIEYANILLSSSLMITKLEELTKLPILSSFLYALTDNTESSITEDPKKIIKYLDKYKIPRCNDEITLDPDYKYFKEFFLIQVEIIFEHYQKRIKEIEKQKVLCFNRSNQIIDEMRDEKDRIDEIKDDEIENDEISDDDYDDDPTRKDDNVLNDILNSKLLKQEMEEEEEEEDNTDSQNYLYKSFFRLDIKNNKKITEEEDESSTAEDVKFDELEDDEEEEKEKERIKKMKKEKEEKEEEERKTKEKEEIKDDNLSDDDIDEKKDFRDEDKGFVISNISNIFDSAFKREHKQSFRKIYSITELPEEKKNEIIADKQGLSFWNPRDYNFYNLNGILYQKTSMEELEITIDKGEATDEIDYYKLFQYNDNEYRWTLFENFKVFDSKFGDKDQIMFYLILNSRLDCLDNVSDSIKKVHQSINDKNISIYAFQYEKNRKKNTFFLTIHVPESKKNHPNLQTIFYQIYVYLFMVSGLSIVSIDEQYFDQQIKFIYRVKEMSLNFSHELSKQNTKESYEPPINHFFQKKPKILFLYTDDDDKLSYYQAVKDKKFKEQSYFGPFKIDTGPNKFNRIIKNNNIDPKLIYSKKELKNLFDFIQKRFTEISGMYIRISEEISLNAIFEKLRNVFIQRFPSIQSKLLKDEETEILIDNILKEFIYFFPTMEYAIVKAFHFVSIDIKQKLSVDTQKMLRETLEKNMKDKLNAIIEEITSSLYMDENKVDNYIRSHINNIKIEFFNIINKEYDGTMIDLIFQKNYDIVISKIKDDTQKIQKTEVRGLK